MDDWALIDWISAIGTTVTVVGLVAAIVQISRTQKAAKAAEIAASAAKSLVRNTLFLVDLGKCQATVAELRTLVETDRYEAAVVRAHDLTAQLILLREASLPQAGDFDFRAAITEVAVLRDSIQRKARDGRRAFDKFDSLETLARWSDELSTIAGVATYADAEMNP